MQDKHINKYARFKAGLFAFAIDEGCLLLQLKDTTSIQLSAQETHGLFNLLYDHRQEIYQANVPAREYGTQKYKRAKSSVK